MSACSKGCGRPVKIRGMCNNHYQAKRTKWIRANIWRGPVSAVGPGRRLRALCAIGWSQAELGRRTGLPACTVSHLVRGDIERTSRRNAVLVHDLFDRLCMTPGPSEWQRRRAQVLGWALPLAWDDDTIDNPNATPDLGERATVTWVERYQELRDLGLSQDEIARRMGIERESLLRQLERHGVAS